MIEEIEGKKVFNISPIGYVERHKGATYMKILQSYIPPLKQLDHFSHVIVLWWADKHDNEKSRSAMQTRPPCARDKLTGVFACRAEYRPNPIGLTICRILEVDDERGIVHVSNIDALDGTPLVGLKGYFPVCDRVKEAHIPEWLSDWPDWMPEEGFGLDE